MHVITVLCLAALASVADLGLVYLAGVAGVAALLVYEQSLVTEHDLSQVKRAFDLNGYVGILYFVSTAAAIYLVNCTKSQRMHGRRSTDRDDTTIATT